MIHHLNMVCRLHLNSQLFNLAKIKEKVMMVLKTSACFSLNKLFNTGFYIQYVLFHAKDFPIPVANLSLKTRFNEEAYRQKKIVLELPFFIYAFYDV